MVPPGHLLKLATAYWAEDILCGGDATMFRADAVNPPKGLFGDAKYRPVIPILKAAFSEEFDAYFPLHDKNGNKRFKDKPDAHYWAHLIAQRVKMMWYEYDGNVKHRNGSAEHYENWSHEVLAECHRRMAEAGWHFGSMRKAAA